MNNLEKEFVSSLRALLYRYGVVIVEQRPAILSSEKEIIFCNSTDERLSEIYISLEELLSAVGTNEVFCLNK